MAYDDYLAERIRHYFTEKHLNYFEKKMMGVWYLCSTIKCVAAFITTKREAAIYSWSEWGQPLRKK